MCRRSFRPPVIRSVASVLPCARVRGGVSGVTSPSFAVRLPPFSFLVKPTHTQAHTHTHTLSHTHTHNKQEVDLAGDSGSMLGLYEEAENYVCNPDLMGRLTGAATQVRF